MTDNKTPRRPVAGSRIPSRSPRRLAGQPARPVERGADEGGADEQVHEPVTSSPPAEPTVAKPEGQAESEGQAEQVPMRPGILHRRRTTTVLAALVGVAAAVLALLVVLQGQEPDGEAVETRTWDPVGRAGEFTLPREGEQPVSVDALEWTSSVDEIAHAVTKVLSFNWETIDDHEELAADLVTEEFLAGDLRETIAETAPKLKKSKAEYVVTVAGQSVISATPTRVRALLFVNQLVTKGTGKAAVSDNYPLRLDVVGELVDGKWLISSLNAG